MQISKPDGERWRDFAINKKQIILSDSLQAVLPVCAALRQEPWGDKGTGKINIRL